MRIGIFGGSFDPLHYGHLLLAETCLEQASLDQIWFIPCAAPPHKPGRVLVPAKQRLEMVELAIAGNERFVASSLEIDRGGLSYTVETLRALTAQRPTDQFFFLMGADSLRDFFTWREPAEICRLAIPLVVRRQGVVEPDLSVLSSWATPQRLEEIRQHQVQMPVIELSSTDLRRRLASGKSIRYRLPRAVEKYIQTHELYQAEPNLPPRSDP